MYTHFHSIFRIEIERITEKQTSYSQPESEDDRKKTIPNEYLNNNSKRIHAVDSYIYLFDEN